MSGFLQLGTEPRGSWLDLGVGEMAGFGSKGEKEGTLPGSNPPLVKCRST